MGRGLSEQQKQILDYLKERHNEGREVVLFHWILIDVCGVIGSKNYSHIGEGFHIDTSLKYNEDYRIKSISLSNSLSALQKRGLIWYRSASARTPEDIPENDDNEWYRMFAYNFGYCLAGTIFSERTIRDTAHHWANIKDGRPALSSKHSKMHN